MTQKPKKIDYTTSNQQLLFNAVNAINGFTSRTDTANQNFQSANQSFQNLLNRISDFKVKLIV